MRRSPSWSRQVREFGVDGLKLYPVFFYDGVGAGCRLDGPDFATPLLEAARDLGIRNVAVHKALWLPPSPRDCFAVDDLDGALERFGDLNFFMVHAGAAFLEQTAGLLAPHHNLYAALEFVFAHVVVRPEGNALRLHGLDAPTVRAATEDDQFAKDCQHGGAVPWVRLRARNRVAGA